MKFQIDYYVGKSLKLRTKIINALNLDDAQKKWEDKGKTWQNIIMVDKTKGKADY